jgi:hypothetical protein
MAVVRRGEHTRKGGALGLRNERSPCFVGPFGMLRSAAETSQSDGPLLTVLRLCVCVCCCACLASCCFCC